MVNFTCTFLIYFKSFHTQIHIRVNNFHAPIFNNQLTPLQFTQEVLQLKENKGKEIQNCCFKIDQILKKTKIHSNIISSKAKYICLF